MKKIAAIVMPLLVLTCAGTGLVEIGVNDEGLVDGPLGWMAMRVQKIEFPEGNSYFTFWEGEQDVTVSLQSANFVTVTNDYQEIDPGSYDHIRLTVDSVRYLDGTETIIIDTTVEFNADAFTQIVIEKNDELRLVVNLNTSVWFSPDSVKIRDLHVPFEGASLKIHYEL